VTRGQSGGYQCEVSADAPLFHTEANVSTMLIAELPKSEPLLNIYGMPGIDSRKIVTIGETFKAGCVSGPSFPPVNFTWSVNGHRYPVSLKHLFNVFNVYKIYMQNHNITTISSQQIMVYGQ